MKIVVGLGNPGKKYDKTRHNVGFDVIKEIAEKNSLGRPKGRFQGETIDLMVGMEKVILLCPLTFMNDSGKSVKAACDFFQIDPETDLLVVCDDLNLDLGAIRFRAKGSSGGQKGLASIIRLLGTEVFPRLRLGIGSPPPNWQVPDFVLGRFHDDDKIEIENSIERASEAVLFWSLNNTLEAMNRFNGSPKAKNAPEKKINSKRKSTNSEPYQSPLNDKHNQQD